jgi:outer membrane protein TolC
MRALGFAAVVVLAAAGAGAQVAPVVTFDEAVTLAARNRPDTTSQSLDSELTALRRALLPSVRAELLGNTSRTLDFFADTPFNIRSANSVVSFDYPLWDGGLTRARISMVERTLRRIRERDQLDDGRYNQLVEAFGQLYVAQAQTDLVRPLYDRLSKEADRTSVLVSSGEMSNLMAAESREIALSFSSQLLELEARRIDAAARLQVLTGLDEAPAVVLDLEDPAAGAAVPPASAEMLRDDQVEASRIAVEDSRLRLREVVASTRFQARLTGFVGLGAAQSDFGGSSSYGTSGVYGLSVNLSYPLLGGRTAIQIAETRAALDQSIMYQDLAVEALRARASEYRLRAQIAQRRIALFRQSVAASREREESLQRLVRGGMRSESELVRAEAERTRREGELLAAEVERWKALQMLARVNEPAESGHR